MDGARSTLVGRDIIFFSNRLVGKWGHPYVEHMIKICLEILKPEGNYQLIDQGLYLMNGQCVHANCFQRIS